MHRSYTCLRRKCAVSGCPFFARSWVKLSEQKYIPVCISCKRAMPKELFTKT